MDAIHVCLNVGDADETGQWYCEQLGFEPSWEFTSGETRNVYVEDGNGFELQLSDTESEDDVAVGTAWDHFAVSVEDVDEAFEEIDHHGVVRGPTDVPAAGARVAFVEDPDGHVVELVESRA